MEKLFIPTLHTFAMNNIFTGSLGLFRFRAAPDIIMATPKEVDFEKAASMWNTGMAFIATKKAPWKGRRPSPSARRDGKI